MTKLNIKHRQTDGCAREEGDDINVLKQNRYQKLDITSTYLLYIPTIQFIPPLSTCPVLDQHCTVRSLTSAHHINIILMECELNGRPAVQVAE